VTTLLDAASAPPRRRLLTLGYHAVADLPAGAPGRELCVTPRAFAGQLRLLRGLGYRLAAAEDLLDGSEDRRAVLTFDDGYRDAITTVAPLVRRHGGRATFFLNPGRWGQDSGWVGGGAGRLLDAGEAAELAAVGMELGAHTMTHPDLRTLSDESARDEIRRSKAAVEDVAGRPCRSFAYPHGSFGERELAAVGEAGFEVAFAWGRGWPWRRLALPRLAGPVRGGAPALGLKLVGASRLRAR
jgi:peptidoglycan/xylan/chitin deacetylase (PgdA/CDA1 family)